jgi:hypothetical protein
MTDLPSPGNRAERPSIDLRTGHFYLARTGHLYLAAIGELRIINIMSKLTCWSWIEELKAFLDALDEEQWRSR